MFTYTKTPNASPMAEGERNRILTDPGYGRYFTDHMVTARWFSDSGWNTAEVRPYGQLALDPAASVLHYGQTIFEGLKAYRWEDGTIWTFRPYENAERFKRSARRLALPEVPVGDFVESLRALVEVDSEWVPNRSEGSLYLRPFLFASEALLSVRPADEVTFSVIASPAGSYFKNGVQPISVWISKDFVRAAQGGTGAAKFGGNYAASLAAQLQAEANGCDQVCFLDAIERRWIEELGGMNIFAVLDDGTLTTPPASGTILEGITRNSVCDIAKDLGYSVSEERLDIAECLDQVRSRRIRELFACGTAAVLTPIGQLVSDSGIVKVNDGVTGQVTRTIRQRLLDVQHGHIEDVHGWMHQLR